MMNYLATFTAVASVLVLSSCDGQGDSATQHRSNTDPESGSMEASRTSGAGNQTASGPGGATNDGKAAPTTVR